MSPSAKKKKSNEKGAADRSPTKQVMQFKVTLLDLKPPIWRRIQVPSLYSFWDLHVAIQDAMGWLDCHLHVFEIKDPKTGRPERFGIPAESSWGDDETRLGREHAIADYFLREKDAALYEYDFGDCWRHSIVLEKILPAEAGIKYPICIAGARKCPPEDCGGVWGYQEFLEAISNPRHKEHRSMLEWVGGPFDPEAFDAAAVHFDNPRKRWKQAFEGER